MKNIIIVMVILSAFFILNSNVFAMVTGPDSIQYVSCTVWNSYGVKYYGYSQSANSVTDTGTAYSVSYYAKYKENTGSVDGNLNWTETVPYDKFIGTFIDDTSLITLGQHPFVRICMAINNAVTGFFEKIRIRFTATAEIEYEDFKMTLSANANFGTGDTNKNYQPVKTLTGQIQYNSANQSYHTLWKDTSTNAVVFEQTYTQVMVSANDDSVDMDIPVEVLTEISEGGEFEIILERYPSHDMETGGGTGTPVVVSITTVEVPVTTMAKITSPLQGATLNEFPNIEYRYRNIPKGKIAINGHIVKTIDLQAPDVLTKIELITYAVDVLSYLQLGTNTVVFYGSEYEVYDMIQFTITNPINPPVDSGGIVAPEFDPEEWVKGVFNNIYNTFPQFLKLIAGIYSFLPMQILILVNIIFCMSIILWFTGRK